MRRTFVLLLLLGSGCAPAPAPPTPLQPQPTPTAAAPARHSTTADLGADARAALAAIPPLATPAHVRLALSPQCGFASTIEGNRISHDDERRKLELVASVARSVWGDH